MKAAALLACACIACAPPPLPPDSAVSSGGRVDVGGRSLYIECEGSGVPAVILEAGLDRASDDWSAVRHGLAPLTRTCAYDRAGLGRSDPVHSFRTSHDVVEDLRSLLHEEEIDPPYVLGGHSFGGIHARLFAAEHPAEVAGLVLLDATHEDEFLRVREMEAEAAGAAGPAGAASFAGATPFNRESIDVAGSLDEIRSADRRLVVPLIVVERGTPLRDDEMPAGWPEDQRARRRAVHRGLQADLASLSPQGLLIAAEGSGPLVPLDRPDVVIAALRRVVGMVRDGRAAR